MRGGARPGAGRKRGSRAVKTSEAALKAAQEGVTPLEYMLNVLRKEDATADEKRWAAEKAAPYVHPRLAAVEHSGKDGGPMELTVSWLAGRSV